MPAPAPQLIVEAFALSAPICSPASPTPGGKTVPFPIPSQIGIVAGAASYNDGFPPLAMTPIASGGTWPYGQDMNGILYAITSNIQAYTGGQYAGYSATWAGANSGYALGAILAMASGEGFWINLSADNATNPDTGGLGWAVLGPYSQLSPGEIANTITPVNTLYPPGHAWRYGAAADNGITDNTIPLRNMLLAAAGYTQAYVPFGGIANAYQLLHHINAPAYTDLVVDGELKWTAVDSPGYNFIGSACTCAISVIGFPFRISGKGELFGPTATGTYTANEFGIIALGTNPSWNNAPNYYGPFIVQNIVINNFGAYGIGGQYLDKVQVIGTEIFNCGYSAMAFLTCRNGTINKNLIHDISPGTSGNLYGIALTHDSAGATQFAVQGGSPSTYFYSNDSHLTSTPVNQRQCTNAFCISFEIDGNTLWNFPAWSAINCHGGFDIKITNNRTYNSYIPIQMSGSSGSAINYAGDGNNVSNNSIYYNKIDGTASTVPTFHSFAHGIILNGGSTIPHSNIVCEGNSLYGNPGNVGSTVSIGDSVGITGGAFGIEMTYVTHSVVTGNAFKYCNGAHIYGTNCDGTISNNTFGPPCVAANSEGVYVNNTGQMVISNNVHENEGGNSLAIGIDCNNAGTVRLSVHGNNMDDATVPFSGNLSFLTKGMASDVPVRIRFTAFAGGTMDLSPCGHSSPIFVDVEEAANETVTGFNGTFVGQEINVMTSNAAGVLTINDTTGQIYLQGGTAAMTQNSTMRFLVSPLAHTGLNIAMEQSRALGNS